MLDNHRYIVLGTKNPDICHIIPLGVSDTEEFRVAFGKWLGAAAFYVYYEKPELVRDSDKSQDDDKNKEWLWALYCHETLSEIGVNDRSWNQISLDKQLHNWWSECYFAFKPLGIGGEITQGLDPKGDTADYTRVKLQFHWMPHRKDSGATPFDISKNARPEDFSDVYEKTYGELETNDLNHRVQTRRHLLYQG
ncbi:hypothetical protein B0T14DRAFT_570594 [Immersiella caudata]|uniref:HNH nuclease domain-containing protein n=1 Tax=Immersiella caudata TaxID=314043 RepID=A0AA40BV37_9PEZI|nr:hypothetical protein B0T14DRAFT_570594 [Immersiella caudata]